MASFLEGRSWEQRLELVRRFHGYASPGVVVGAQLVDFVCRRLPGGILYDAVCETAKCLPDAVQLFTPCTVGNGWLRIIDWGRFAVTLYDKHNGPGIRGFLHAEKIERWPEVATWFFKRKPKKEQNTPLLMEQIREAGSGFFGSQRVLVAPGRENDRSKGEPRICTGCGEVHRSSRSGVCSYCRGETYYQVVAQEDSERFPLGTTGAEERHA
jgi:formylmethanofuran dehydrogenase subunit E